MNKETAKQEVEKIVNKFLAIPKKELDGMKEEQIKFRFIEPLLEALGWEREDIGRNKKRKFETYRRCFNWRNSN